MSPLARRLTLTPGLGPAILVLVLLAAPALAQPRGYSIESFRVSLEVSSDGSLLVREAIAFAFRGSHQGIFRTIPVRYERQGFNYVLRVDRIQVLDEQGMPLKSEVSDVGRYLRIKAWVSGAQDATREVSVLYRVRRGLLSFDDHDELYWNVTGNEWLVPIGTAEALVTLPRSVPMESVRVLAFTGPSGAVGQDYVLDRLENLLVFRTSRSLRVREGLTVVVGWPSGHVRLPSRMQELGWFLLDQRWFALPLVVFALCLVAWQSFGRDPVRGRSIKPEYEPPRGLRPGEAGSLMDEVVHPRDVVATVVDLAVRGHLTIEQVPAAPGNHDYLLKLSKPWLGDPDFAPFEVILLAQVFGSSKAAASKLLSEVRRNSGAIFQPIREQIYRDLVKKRYFLASPQAVRAFWRAIGVGVFAVPVGLFGVASAVGMMLPVSLSLLLAFAASGLIILAFARVMPRKAFRGARARVHILGFQEFLERAEKDRLRRLPPDTLHKWLPYAIALGVEEAWIWRFDGLSVAEPTWYTSTDPFSLPRYSTGVRELGRHIEAAWTTGRRAGAWSGAAGGGSGFSGGASGGGFGGGGGGTF